MSVRTPSSESRKLVIGKERVDRRDAGKLRLKETGITVKGDFEWQGKPYNPSTGGVDLGLLDTDSLSKYLRSKGGANDLAEDIVRSLLDHPPLVKND